MTVEDARDYVDHEWEWLTSIERSELHLLVDELASERLPAAAIDTEEAAA